MVWRLRPPHQSHQFTWIDTGARLLTLYSYKTMFDKFARLRAIESGQAVASTAPNVRFWNFVRDGNIMEL